MLKRLKADLHIHTCLSPCGQSECVPTNIVAAALEKDLQVIGICDHNASENVASVRKAAGDKDLTVLGGMEITSLEEIHILGLFDGSDELAAMQMLIYNNLPGRNDAAVFGAQYIVDQDDYVTGYNEHLLIGATELSVDRIVSAIRDLGGLAIASHVDREAFSIMSQLGFIPEGLDLDGLEVSCRYRDSRFPLQGLDYPFVAFSDAHLPADIGSLTTEFIVETARISEMRDALQGRRGRSFESPVQWN